MRQPSLLFFSCVLLSIMLCASSKIGHLDFEPSIQKFEMYMSDSIQGVNNAELLEINVGYLTGSKRKPGDKEYSRPGLTISGGLTYALANLKTQKIFDNLTIFEHLNGSQVNVNVSIKFNVFIAETYGDEEISLKQIANLWRLHNISVIIGPQESCLHEAKLASSLNIPMISYFCSDEQPSDKKMFTTFSRTRPPDASVSRAVTSLVLNYGWLKSITIITSDTGGNDQRFSRVGKSLSMLLKQNDVQKIQMMSYRGPYHHGYGENPFDGIVSQTKTSTRIYIVISEYYEHLGLVLAMKKQNLLSGEYQIIGVSIDDFKEDKWNPTSYFSGLLHDGSTNNSQSKNISIDFSCYLGIVASPPKDFTSFSKQVNFYLEQPPFNYPNPLANIGKNKRIRLEGAYLYDAVTLYAHVVENIIKEGFTSRNNSFYNRNQQHQHHHDHQHHRQHEHEHEREQQKQPHHHKTHPSTPTTVSAGTVTGSLKTTNGWTNHESQHHVMNLLKRKIFNGVEISMRLRNLSYKSAIGHDSEMDENGDARGNFTLLSLKKKYGDFGLYPVGFFLRRPTGLPAVHLTEPIDWVNGSPPLAEPKCGFYNEKCESDNGPILFMAITSLILFITGSAIYLSFRHWRLSKDMDALMWRIDKREIQWEDDGQSITFPHGRNCSRSRSMTSYTNNKGGLSSTGSGTGGGGGAAAGTDTGSQASLIRFSTVYAPLVTYRERHFAAKKIDIDVFDSHMKQQLQMLREIRHENLNVFVGACHYDDGLLLINDYCTRGSIKDILENEAIKLDDMFISSLVGDLLRGLSYLHNSTPFKFHGNLKPTNCLIDSRWVLKLSDFGFLKPGSLSRDNSGSRKVAAVAEPIIIDTAFGGPQVLITDSNCSLHTVASATNATHVFKPSNWRSHYQNQRQVTPVTCPYLAPEHQLLISGHVKNVADGFRRSDIYSLGIILWELLRREPLCAYVGIKNESELRLHIINNASTFWSSALQYLSNDFSLTTGGGSGGGLTVFQTSTLSPPSPQGQQRTSSFYKNYRLNKSNNTISNSARTSSSFHNNNTKQMKQQGSCNNITITGGCTPTTIGNNNNNSFSVSSQIIDTLSSCLQFDPEQRPDIKTVGNKLRPLHKGMRSNIFDIMIGLMEKYANNLEILVDDRTKQLSEEKRKTDSLLYELIPATVAEELKEGHHVSAQSYESIQIFFSDIVGFTEMSAESTPLQVVEFLNDLYSCFDSVIDNFDVYKVETIGDAYMVASGLPIPKEGNFHAIEMARMALELLRTVSTFKIHHRPSEILKLRCGIHSGPICAGVVGHKRPRYCLFGDTVNTASRMESTGAPLRIHCSQEFATLVQDNFELEQRGWIDVKGKGDMMTYWLIRDKIVTNGSNMTPVIASTISVT